MRSSASARCAIERTSLVLASSPCSICSEMPSTLSNVCRARLPSADQGRAGGLRKESSRSDDGMEVLPVRLGEGGPRAETATPDRFGGERQVATVFVPSSHAPGT